MHYLHFFIHYFASEKHYLHFARRAFQTLLKVKYVKVRAAENKRGKRP